MLWKLLPVTTRQLFNSRILIHTPQTNGAMYNEGAGLAWRSALLMLACTTLNMPKPDTGAYRPSYVFKTLNGVHNLIMNVCMWDDPELTAVVHQR